MTSLEPRRTSLHSYKSQDWQIRGTLRYNEVHFSNEVQWGTMRHNTQNEAQWGTWGTMRHSFEWVNLSQALKIGYQESQWASPLPTLPGRGSPVPPPTQGWVSSTGWGEGPQGVTPRGPSQGGVPMSTSPQVNQPEQVLNPSSYSGYIVPHWGTLGYTFSFGVQWPRLASINHCLPQF